MSGKGFLSGGGGGIWKLGKKGLPTSGIVVCGWDDMKLLGPSGNEGIMLCTKANELGLVNG